MFDEKPESEDEYYEGFAAYLDGSEGSLCSTCGGTGYQDDIGGEPDERITSPCHECNNHPSERAAALRTSTSSGEAQDGERTDLEAEWDRVEHLSFLGNFNVSWDGQTYQMSAVGRHEVYVGGTLREAIDNSMRTDRERFDRATHPQELGCWRMACIAQDLLTQTDAENALEATNGK